MRGTRYRSVPVPAADEIERAERAHHEQAVAEAKEAYEREAQYTREREVEVLRQLQAAIITEERTTAYCSGIGANALSYRREVTRAISRELTRLEEQRREILASKRHIIDAQLRVEVVSKRCVELNNSLETQPAEAAAALARQRSELELEVESLELESQLQLAASQGDATSEVEAWADVRERADALMNSAEDFRMSLALLERHVEERAAQRKAGLQAAVRAKEARLAPSRKEVADLYREVEALRLTLSNQKATAPAVDPEQKRREQKEEALNAEKKRLEAIVAALEAQEAELKEAERQQQAKDAKTPRVDPVPAKPLVPAKPPPKGGKLPPIAAGSKTSAVQRARLAALQGKYGNNVARNLGNVPTNPERQKKVLGAAGGTSTAPSQN